MLDPTCAIGRASPAGSRMTIPPNAPRHLVGCVLPFTEAARRRWKGSLTPTLGLLLLCYWIGVEQKMIKGHCSLDHHFAFTLVSFYFQGAY